MKIAIVVPIHGREGTTETVSWVLWNFHVQEAARYGIDIAPMLVRSLSDSEALGAKLNRALADVRLREWDYLMILGSDDLLRPQIWGYIRTAIEEELPFFGFNQAIIYDRIQHKAKLWDHGASTIGAARCIRRDVVEKCGWKMWDDDKHNGIDSNQEWNVWVRTGIDFPVIIPTLRPVICDIKDGENLNSFDDVPGVGVNVERIRKDFPALEAWPLPDTMQDMFSRIAWTVSTTGPQNEGTISDAVHTKEAG